ncbi:C40 family peptidase [Alicyclobacillus ferrooxydans]|uniref:C40 family peptidase n=1 Tax=Alicyclobacillus ferrooxydans TaxID=471514 RepID=UPI0006D5974D|nr:NlpC/P60 family protein [Alicyclobacillus ferrooxydans]
MRTKCCLSVAATLSTLLTIISPVTAHAATTSSTRTGPYTVKPGDCLYDIAATLHISLGSLEEANPKVHHGLIYPGEKLAIPSNAITRPITKETASRVTTKRIPSQRTKQTVSPTTRRGVATSVKASVYSSELTQEILHTAYSLEGIHYHWGGTSPATGFDCSGFVQYIFATHGIHLPRTASGQSKVGRTVKLSQLQPGDLMFYSDTYSYQTSQVTHVALYIGNGNVIESSSVRNQGVIVIHNIMQNPWYRSRYYGARNVIGN